MFSVVDGQLMIGDRCSTEVAPVIELPNRNVRRIWGQVGEWLLVESGEPGISGQGTWPLTAVRLDGSNYQLLTEQIYFGTPVISGNEYVLIPTDDQQVLYWDGQDITETEYEPFYAGGFSPDGAHLALIHADKLAVYDSEGNGIASLNFKPPVFDSPPLPPAWHPDSNIVAVDEADHSTQTPSAYLLDVTTGESQKISMGLNPQFSPNGRWLITSYPADNTKANITDLITGQRYDITLNGWPVAWIAPEEAAVGPEYNDEALHFSLELPASWTAVHANGTTTIRNQAGEPQLRVRTYFNRGSFLSAGEIAENSAPPGTKDSLTFTEATIASYPAIQTNTAVTYINVGGRYLAFEKVGDDPIVSILLGTLQAERTDFNDNYILLSSENWLAELSGGANYTETLTVQRRDGSAGYTLFTEPPTEGLGYTLAEPLFFTPDEQFLFYNQRSVADGCGLYAGGGDLVQVNLSSGVKTTRENTSGVGHTLSPDGQTIAFLRGYLSNEFTLHLYDLSNGQTETITFPLDGADAAAGSLIFSPDGSQVAFAAQQAFCGDGWTIGTIDVATAELTTYPAEHLAFWRPIAWVDDLVVLRPFTRDDTQYLDLTTGEFLPERP